MSAVEIVLSHCGQIPTFFISEFPNHFSNIYNFRIDLIQKVTHIKCSQHFLSQYLTDLSSGHLLSGAACEDWRGDSSGRDCRLRTADCETLPGMERGNDPLQPPLSHLLALSDHVLSLLPKHVVVSEDRLYFSFKKALERCF